MRLRNIPRARSFLEAHPDWVVLEASQIKGSWSSRFQKPDQALYLEIGSGKGQFIVEMARQNPSINFIGMEVHESVILRILEKQVMDPLPNLQLLAGNARHLLDYFKADEVHKLFLNFSDPWPKKRHAKRRLTAPQFLQMYERVLADTGSLQLKTDNQGLFEYSLVSLSKQTWPLEKVSLDLHASDFEGNVMTEYEEKFSSQGHRIYLLSAKHPKKYH